MAGFRLLIFLVVCLPVLAEDTTLAALRTTLLGMRDKPIDYGGPRGATPHLSVAKHQLRDWVESRLTGLTEGGGEAVFERQTLATLHQAKLICTDAQTNGLEPCPVHTILGFLGVVTRQVGFLEVRTGVSIECGFY